MKPYKKNWNEGFVHFAEIYFNPEKKVFNFHFSYKANNRILINFRNYLIWFIHGMTNCSEEFFRNFRNTDKNRKTPK